MPTRFMDRARFNRAKRIKDNKVPEFEKLSSDPIIVYGEIQGSGSKPYKIMIDMKERHVHHDCPDIRRPNNVWCKHLGKILLNLEPSEIDEIYHYYNQNGKVNFKTSHLNELVKNYQLEFVDNDSFQLNDEVSLIDLMKIIERFDDKHVPQNIINQLKNLIDNEFNELTSLQIPMHLSQLLNGLNQHIIKQIDTLLDDQLSNLTIEALNQFISQFFTLSSKFKLELTYYLRDLIQVFNIQVDTFDIDNSKYHENELMELTIVLSLLLTNIEDRQRIIGSLGLEYTEIKLKPIQRRLAHTLRLKGTTHRGLKIWAESKLDYKERKLDIRDNIDDILIYIMKSMGAKPNINPKFNNKLGIWSLPVYVLEQQPTLMFCLRRIIEDERDYVTRAEARQHKKFFDYLKGDNVQTNWLETVRSFNDDAALPSDGIIIQWDITGKAQHEELLHATTDNYRVIVDQNSPISNKIQPFDITICKPNLSIVDRTLRIAYPEYVISIDQVIMYLKQGISILSNILPWRILAQYYMGGSIKGAMVQKAIKQCQLHLFAYGAKPLKDRLDQLKDIGKSGMSEELFKKVHSFIASDTGRLNKRSRPQIDKIITAEGDDLNILFNYANLDKKGKQKIVIKAMKKTNTIDQFRKQVISLIVNRFITEDLNNDFIDELNTIDLGIYEGYKQELVKKTRSILDSIKRKLAKTRLTRKKLRNTVIGEALADEASVGYAGSLTDDEISGLNILLNKFDF